MLPLVLRVALAAGVVPCGVVAQAPGAEVQAALQVEIVAVFFAITAAVAAGEVIVQQQRVDPLIPLFRGI